MGSTSGWAGQIFFDGEASDVGSPGNCDCHQRRVRNIVDIRAQVERGRWVGLPQKRRWGNEQEETETTEKTENEKLRFLCWLLLKPPFFWLLAAMVGFPFKVGSKAGITGRVASEVGGSGACRRL